MTGLDLVPSCKFIAALAQLPIGERPNGVFCIEATGTSGRVLAAVRQCKLDAWKEMMGTFTTPGFSEVTFKQVPKICTLAAGLAQKAGLVSLLPAGYACYRRTGSGYLFLWQSGLDFFLTMNTIGSRHSYHRFWLGDAKFPQRSTKQFML